MKKIPSLFVRDYEKSFDAPDVEIVLDDSGGGAWKETMQKVKYGRFLATKQVTPGCEWVINGEGVATRKWDGTAVMLKRGVLYKRFDAKQGRPVDSHFEPCQDPDPITGHWPGWTPVYEHLPENKWIIEAFSNKCEGRKPHGLSDGTYEAIGPKINGNRDRYNYHTLKMHGEWPVFVKASDRNFGRLKDILSTTEIEGIVFHHPDGRMCKVKRSDFGLKW